MHAQRLLALVLRLAGVVLLLATFAVFLPVEWMATSHRWLGLGDFPASPLVDYLTRTISVLYAIHGGLFLLVSFDLERYAPVINYLGFTEVGLGVAFLAIDLHAGLPLYWTLLEGPPVVLTGLLILYLLRRRHLSGLRGPEN